MGVCVSFPGDSIGGPPSSFVFSEDDLLLLGFGSLVTPVALGIWALRARSVSQRPLSRSAALSLPLATLSPAPLNNTWDGAGWDGEPRLPLSLKADQEILFMHATKWDVMQI